MQNQNCVLILYPVESREPGVPAPRRRLRRAARLLCRGQEKRPRMQTDFYLQSSSRSTMIASPMPPPMHMVARPMVRSRLIIS